MLVKRWMSKEVITIERDALLSDAVKLMGAHKKHFLPVMENGELVGIVTDGDIKKASASDDATLQVHESPGPVSRARVREVMSKPAITVRPDHTVEEAADILLKNRISDVPVVDDQSRLKGVITQTDIFKVLMTLTAHNQKGIQIGLLVTDRRGILKKIAETVRRHNGRFLNALTLRETLPEGYCEVFIRIREIDRECLDVLLEQLEKQAKLLFWIDHATGRRRIFDDRPGSRGRMKRRSSD